MREEGNHLDLNNLPEDYGEKYREGKQVLEEDSTTSTEATDPSWIRKKKNGRKEGMDESDKVYECRFCSLKFCKSQALGGHMNRHRQERETETLNRARQLVFSNEGLSTEGLFSHLGCSAHTIAAGNFHQRGVIGEPPIHLTPLYTRLPSPSSVFSTPPQQYPPIQPAYMYPSSSSGFLIPFHSSYPSHPVKDYFIGQVVPGDNSQPLHHPPNHHYNSGEPSYPCMGAPLVNYGFSNDGLRATTRDQVNVRPLDDQGSGHSSSSASRCREEL